MAKPTYFLRAAFGTTPFATAIVWTDISSDMQEFHVRRGRQHELDRMEAGVATFVLDNASHNYYPDNAAGTYYPNIACMKKVNLLGIHGTQGWALPAGFTDPDSAWTDEAKAYDDNTATYAYAPAQETPLLLTPVAPTFTNQIRIWANTWSNILHGYTGYNYALIEAYYNGAWHTIKNNDTSFAGGTWVTFPLDNIHCGETARITPAVTNGTIHVFEFAFGSYTPYPIYTGYAQSWAPFWKGQLTVAPSIRLNCADALRSFARYLVNGTTFPQQTSGTRVIGVLDSFGFPNVDREIDAGQELISSLATYNTNALDHLQSVQESELGLFYQLTNGKVIYEDRTHRTLGSHGTAQATFGDDAGEQKYTAVDFAFEDTLIYNDIRATRVGGSEQVASDADSIAKYGVRSLSRSNLLLTGDVAAKVNALRIGTRYADVTKSRVKSITIASGRDESNLYPLTLGYEISTRIGVRLNQAGIDSEYFIEGVNHDWTAKSNELITKWQLSEATQYLPTLPQTTYTMAINGNGSHIGIGSQEPNTGSHYDKVNETEANDATSVFTQIALGGGYDLYTLQPVNYYGATIDKIAVTIRCRSTEGTAIGGTATIKLMTYGTEYVGNDYTLSGAAYNNYTDDWTTNPKTGDAWTWSELDSLQAGVRIIPNGGFYALHHCSWEEVKIYFTPTW